MSVVVPPDALQRAVWRRQAQQRRAGLRAGTWRRRQPADLAREQVARLRDWGLSVQAIAAMSGLAPSVISPLYWPNHGAHRQWVLPSTIDALTHITSPLQAPDWAQISAAGTARRIGALQAIGWSQQVIADQLGVTRQAVAAIKRAPRVQASTARKVAAVYDRLSMTPGPDPKTRAWARKYGYLPPLAWDDESIDDPTATPATEEAAPDGGVDHVVITLILTGHPTPTTTAEREQLIPTLVESGLTDGQIADLCHTTDRTIFRTRQRLGIRSRWTA